MARAGFLAIAVAMCLGCGKQKAAPDADPGFAALQTRGQMAMGVDQYASAHVFEPLPDGGRIVLQMKDTNPVEEKKIRDHMRTIAAAFAAGDFSLPGFVHAGEVPGTAAMARLRGSISYAARDLERGGEVRVTTTDPAAVKAVHEFLAFQKADHRAGH